MFRWFRDRRRQMKFDRGFIRAARNEHKAGRISDQKMAACERAINNPKVMRDARRQMMMNDHLLGGFKDWNWEAIYQWFVLYIIPALRIIIPMLLMAEEKRDE